MYKINILTNLEINVAFHRLSLVCLSCVEHNNWKQEKIKENFWKFDFNCYIETCYLC